MAQLEDLMDKNGTKSVIKTLIQELKKPFMFFAQEDLTKMMSAVLIRYAEDSKVTQLHTDSLIFQDKVGRTLSELLGKVEDTEYKMDKVKQEFNKMQEKLLDQIRDTQLKMKKNVHDSLNSYVTLSQLEDSSFKLNTKIRAIQSDLQLKYVTSQQHKKATDAVRDALQVMFYTKKDAMAMHRQLESDLHINNTKTIEHSKELKQHHSEILLLEKRIEEKAEMFMIKDINMELKRFALYEDLKELHTIVVPKVKEFTEKIEAFTGEH